MKTSELEQIVTLISGLGDNATQGFIYYLMTYTGVEIIGYAMGVFIFTLLYKIIKVGLNLINDNADAIRQLKEVRDTLEVGSTGRYSNSEHSSVINMVKHLLDNQKETE